MVMDMFCGSLRDPTPQRDLLVIPTPTLADAVQAKNDYLRIQGTTLPWLLFGMSFSGEPPDQVNLAKTEVIYQLATLIQSFLENVARLQEWVHCWAEERNRQATIYWRCSGLWHVQKEGPITQNWFRETKEGHNSSSGCWLCKGHKNSNTVINHPGPNESWRIALPRKD